MHPPGLVGDGHVRPPIATASPGRHVLEPAQLGSDTRRHAERGIRDLRHSSGRNNQQKGSHQASLHSRVQNQAGPGSRSRARIRPFCEVRPSREAVIRGLSSGFPAVGHNALIPDRITGHETRRSDQLADRRPVPPVRCRFT